jgi:hypothetical protein
VSDPLKIFEAPLTGDFQATDPFMIQGDHFAVDFDLTVAGAGAAQVEWYVELTSDPVTDPTWRREVAENNSGADGVTAMPMVVRVFRQSDNSLLPAGEHNLAVPLHRSHHFGRLQIRLAAGGATTAVIYAPFGAAVIAP